MNTVNVKIETAQKGVISTVSSLTNSNIRGIKMAKKYFNISEISFQTKSTHKSFIDLEGKTFGRLTVLGCAPRKEETIRWFCRCICGRIVIVVGRNLKNGTTKSCGCLSDERKRARGTIRIGAEAEYRAYHLAKNRCQNSNNEAYKDYGGRGIEFRFESFAEFLAEVGRKPSFTHGIDRKDNDGHYEKGNVRWATPEQQSRNRRNNIILTIDGETKILVEWVETTKIKYHTAKSRLYKGWCGECAVSATVKTCSHRQQNLAIH